MGIYDASRREVEAPRGIYWLSFKYDARNLDDKSPVRGALITASVFLLPSAETGDPDELINLDRNRTIKRWIAHHPP